MQNVELDVILTALVLQPTSLCNVNCTYCYLPHRRSSLQMSVEIAHSIAQGLRLTDRAPMVDVIWHGGEPLAVGCKHFELLLEPFDQQLDNDAIAFSVQTNATLLSSKWCKLFKRHNVNVGVSIDGPRWANGNRRDLRGDAFFDRILRRISQLRNDHIDFSVIAVVTGDTIAEITDRIHEYYRFFVGLGCTVLGINIEEREGVNSHRDQPDGAPVDRFWDALFTEWRLDPSLRIRELDRTLGYISRVIDGLGGNETGTAPRVDVFPTVAWNGDVVLLSPELAGTADAQYANFVVGNVLSEPLDRILCRAAEVGYVKEFLAGVERCQLQCGYFDYCGGGQASNKYFEHSTFDCTTTRYCTNRKQRLIDRVMAGLVGREKTGRNS